MEERDSMAKLVLEDEFDGGGVSNSGGLQVVAVVVAMAAVLVVSGVKVYSDIGVAGGVASSSDEEELCSDIFFPIFGFGSY